MKTQKTTLNRFQPWVVCVLALSLNQAFTVPAEAADAAHPGLKTSIPWSQISAKAEADYQGEGLAVVPTAEGARLRCVFQRLEAEATPEGLWMTSTTTNAANDHFRVVAAKVGTHATASVNGPGGATRWDVSLPRTGTVAVEGQMVRFARPGLVEEYSASLDGVRQDFVLPARPAGSGELAVWLAVSGAKVEPATRGAQLVLDGSGRKIAYSRLRATDATGKELPARIEVSDESEIGLAVVVDDAEAVYPVRIDPTFSDANWTSMNPSIPGTDGPVYAAVVDGSGNLYIGGSFTVVGGTVANGVAKWDGTNWSALGSGMSSNVSALAVSGSNLYAGGAFTTAGGSAANYIAKWDGTNWSALGSGMNGGVSALAVSGSNLYAAGGFTTAGGSAANYIAKWDGRAWSALSWANPFGGMPERPALAVSGTNVYAAAHGGGATAWPPGPDYIYIQKWDGNAWSLLGSPFLTGPGALSALAVSGTSLYAAGPGIFKWDGNGWSAVGAGIQGYVNALAVSGDDLYAGSGQYGQGQIAKWDGSSWSALGSWLDYSVMALAVSGTNVYAGGSPQYYMAYSSWSLATNIAKWDGSSWNALAWSNSMMNGVVYALATSGNDLYAGGTFTTVGGTAANHIAKWDGSSWSALGSGIPGPGATANVYALAASGTKLYAGGDFRTAGGTPNYIAQWDGNSWSVLGPVGTGILDGVVYALTVSGSNLYAGGWFSTAGGVSVANIAKWDGNNWSALGSGLNASVLALTILGSDLYAGGWFSTAGGMSATNIAKWDGSSWSALGSGLGPLTIVNGVFALAVSGGNLYAGGWFSTAGGVSATNIAKWDGSSWSAVGSGLNAGVYALTVSGSDLYASVSSHQGALPLRWSPGYNLARWNGSAWSAAGSGLNYGVSALAVLGGDLYAGGSFTIAGGKVSAYIARAHLFSPPALSIVRSGKAVLVSWPSVDTAGFALEQADKLAPPISWVPITASITDFGTNKSVTLPATNRQQFFRLQSP